MVIAVLFFSPVEVVLDLFRIEGTIQPFIVYMYITHIVYVIVVFKYFAKNKRDH